MPNSGLSKNKILLVGLGLAIGGGALLGGLAAAATNQALRY
jgi:hypothetical protein